MFQLHAQFTQILKSSKIFLGSLSKTLDEEIAEVCRNQPFGIMCDESNDRTEGKNFVILVRVYDEDSCEVKTRFIDMPVCSIGTGLNLFDALKISLSHRNIPWNNIVAYNSDNASVMKGKHNSVL